MTLKFEMENSTISIKNSCLAKKLFIILNVYNHQQKIMSYNLVQKNDVMCHLKH
jgi:hypothetical protein